MSWLTYAFRIYTLPIGLFGVSIATAVLPAVSHHAALQDKGCDPRHHLAGIGLMLMLERAGHAGSHRARDADRSTALEHGRFGAADTAPTAAALQVYAVGLVGYSAARIASPTFYALGQSRVPVFVSVRHIANIVLSLVLVRSLGFRGLALGTSLAALGNGAALMVLLHRRLDGINGRQLAHAGQGDFGRDCDDGRRAAWNSMALRRQHSLVPRRCGWVWPLAAGLGHWRCRRGFFE